MRGGVGLAGQVVWPSRGPRLDAAARSPIRRRRREGENRQQPIRPTWSTPSSSVFCSPHVIVPRQTLLTRRSEPPSFVYCISFDAADAATTEVLAEALAEQ